jgi:hypothetical protein
MEGPGGAQNTVKEKKNSTSKCGYNTYRGWTQIAYQNRHCIIDQKGEGTWDDGGGDGKTNFTLRIKEQATRLTLREHDDDDDDDDDDNDDDVTNFLAGILRCEVNATVRCCPLSSRSLH